MRVCVITSRCAFDPPNRTATSRSGSSTSTQVRKSPAIERDERAAHRQPDLADHPPVRPRLAGAALDRGDERGGVRLAVRAEERHERVDVVEHVVAVLDPRPPVVGERLESPAHVVAAEAKPPEHRRRVDHLQRHVASVRADARVVELEHARDVTEVEVIEGEVPEVVEDERIVRVPAPAPLGEPGDALREPRLHLHHVRDRVARPPVARVELDCAAAHLLGARVVAVLLEAERVHAEEVPVAGHPLVPGVQGARDDVAERELTTEVERGDVGGLDGEGVARVLDGDARIAIERGVEVALEPRPRRGQVGALARRRRARSAPPLPRRPRAASPRATARSRPRRASPSGSVRGRSPGPLPGRRRLWRAGSPE